MCVLFFFFQAEAGIRDLTVTGVQTCALPICKAPGSGVDVSTTLEIEPIPPNRSRLKWSASSEVRGTVASVGARLLKGTAKKLTEHFWDTFAARVGEGARFK